MTDNNEPSYDEATYYSAAERNKGRLATLGSVVGLGGTLLCSLSMTAAAVGLFAAGGAAAAQGGMAGMGAGDHGGSGAGAAHNPEWLNVLLRLGPEILVVSLLLIAASVALRRRWATLPALGGGLILYLGMYGQPNLALMYGAIFVGTILLVLAYVASLRPARGSR